MRRFLCCLAVLTASAHASAQDPEPTPPPAEAPPSPPASPAPAPDVLWHLHYGEARDRLVTGDFAAAARDFGELAKTAPGPVERALAEEQASLAREWAGKNLAFVNRADLADASLAEKAVDLRTSDELAGLYTSAVAYGLGSGLWIDSVTQPRGSAGAILPPLLGAGAAVGGVAALDAGRGMRYGIPSSISSGLFVGLEEGIIWALWNQAQVSSSRWEGTTASTFVWGSATIGAVAGGILGASVPITPGRALWVSAGSTWGGVLMGTTVAAIAADPHADRPSLGAAGLGVTGGAIAGILTAGSVSPSGARVQLVNLGGVSGFLVFGGIYLAAADKNSNGHAALGMAALGSATGLTAAWLLTQGMHGDTPRAPSTPPPVVSTLMPSVNPVPGGATLGVQGMLF